MAKFEGVWVKIEGVMANPKNRQMWDLWSWEVEFGIESLGMKYAEWDCRNVSEVSGKTKLKQGTYGRKTEFFFQKWISNGGAKGIYNDAERIEKWLDLKWQLDLERISE